MALAENVRLLRQRRGLTRRELAQRLGLEYETIANIENRRITNPGGIVIASIAAALGVEAEDLLAADALDALRRVYQELKASDDRTLVAWATKAIADCERFLQALRNGDSIALVPSIEELPDIEIEWLTALVGTAHESLDATSCLAQADWWSSRRGQDYLRRNVELATHRGVKIRRLFVFESAADRSAGFEQVQLQRTFGLEIGCLTMDEMDINVRSQLLLVWDMALVDRRWLVHLPSLSRKRMVTDAQLTREDIRVRSATESFELLWRASKRLP